MVITQDSLSRGTIVLGESNPYIILPLMLFLSGSGMDILFIYHGDKTGTAEKIPRTH